LVHSNKALVRNANAMRVAPEVANHLFRTAEGTLGVNDPWLAVEPVAQPLPGIGIGIPIAWQEEQAAREGRIERGEELAAKQGAEHLHREEVLATRGHPMRACPREPAAGYDGVYMRMESEGARPRVEHHRDPQLGPQTLGVFSEL